MRLAFTLVVLVVSSPVLASGQLYYGSRAGMMVDVVSMSGLDSAHAVIHTRHTRDNAITFCRNYVQKVTPKCIKDELATRLNDDVTANCLTGEFTDFSGSRYRFAGKSKDKESMAAYRIVDLATGEDADGSNASGYSTNAAIYGALCPQHAPADEEFHYP